MVASIALGIAVDDTVHTLATWRRARARGLAAAPAARSAYADVGPAMVTTAIAACIGFFCVMRSAFVPIRSFGLLAGTAMLVALLADLLVLPALLVLFGGRREPAR
jgi:predicted RND superfamily exporter protein